MSEPQIAFEMKIKNAIWKLQTLMPHDKKLQTNHTLTCVPSMVCLCDIPTSLNPLIWVVGFRNKTFFFAKRGHWRLKRFDFPWSSAFTRPDTSEITSPLKQRLHLAFSVEHPFCKSSKWASLTSLPHTVWRWKDEHLWTTWLRMFLQTGPSICMPVPGSSGPEELS